MVDKGKFEQIIVRFKDHPNVKDLEKQIDNEALNERKKMVDRICFLEKEREEKIIPLREVVKSGEERVKVARNELDEAQRELSTAESRWRDEDRKI